MKNSIVFLFILASILSACLSPSGDAPQVTVTSEVTVTLPLASPTLEATSTPEPTPTSAPQGFSLEALASMSDEDKNEILSSFAESVQVPEGYKVSEVSFAGEIAVRVVIESESDPNLKYIYAAKDLTTGETYDGVGVKEYGDGQYFYLFILNDSSLKEAMPEIPYEYLTLEKADQEAAAGFNTVALALGEKAGIIAENMLFGASSKLKTVEQKNAYFESQILPKVEDGSIWEDPKVNSSVMLGNSVVPQIPKIVLVRGMSNTTRQAEKFDDPNWIKTTYDEESNILEVSIFPNEKDYEGNFKNLIGDETIVALRYLVQSRRSNVGNGGQTDSTVIIAYRYFGRLLPSAQPAENPKSGTLDRLKDMPLIWTDLVDKSFYSDALEPLR